MSRARKAKVLPSNVVPIRPSVDVFGPAMRPRFGLTCGGVWVAQQWERLEVPHRMFIENYIDECLRGQ
jgi:hypothetical protein